MTRFDVKQIPTGRPDMPRKVVVVERRSDKIVLLIAARSNGQSLEMVTTHTLPGGDEAGLTKLLSDTQADRVIHILPGGQAICRTLEIPAMEPEQIPETLALQAEAALPASLDPHRRAAVLLPWYAEGAETYPALAVGWPGEPDRTQEEDDDTHRYVPQVACLMELLALDQQDGLAGLIDRSAGTIGLIMHRSDQVAVRTARLSGPSHERSEYVEQLVRETAFAAGLDSGDEGDSSGGGMIDAWCANIATATKARQRALVLEERLIQAAAKQVAKTPSADKSEWWADYGLLVGALIGLTGPRRAAFDLEPEPPDIPVNLIDRSVLWLGESNHAFMTGLVAFLALLILPLAASYGRYTLLNLKTANLEELSETTAGFEDEVLLHDLLMEHRLPMTKLISDICSASNIDTQFETLTIKSSDRRITITGLAPSVDRLGELHDYLTATRLFEGGRMSDDGDRENGRSFNFSGTVSSPFVNVEAQYNYRDEPIWTTYWSEPPELKPRISFMPDRPYDLSQSGGGGGALYAQDPGDDLGGDGASRSSGGGQFNSNSSAARRSGSGNAGNASSSGRTGAPQGAAADPANPPDPLTPEQIKRLDESETIAAMLVRSKLKYRTDVLEPDVIARLKREWDLLIEHRRELKQ
ncbi:MAG: hypothetical protein D8M59_04525 [Planctomycetes bacterium]|nr:hypothetical protein [Planctomycetota bacterium]